MLPMLSVRSVGKETTVKVEETRPLGRVKSEGA